MACKVTIDEWVVLFLVFLKGPSDVQKWMLHGSEY